MNYLLTNVKSPKAARNGRLFLPLKDYLEQARTVIAGHAPGGARATMLRSEDAIGFVAQRMMEADWSYDQARHDNRAGWRTWAGALATRKWSKRLAKQRNPEPLSGEEIDHRQERTDQADRIAEVDRLMGCLTRQERRLLVMRHAHGMTYAQICRAEAARGRVIGPDTARVRVAAALEKVRRAA